ncbi:outer membrane protein assembly factor BamD [Candidatus Babeliales bacterium]|nr:outer membrane protein assembly factor BamD [Candidatus Babeliales bacterium]
MQRFFAVTLFLMTVCCISLDAKFNSLNSKKVKHQYPVSGKVVKHMDQQELEQVIEYAKNIGDSELAFKAYYHIMNKTAKHEDLRVYKLGLADYCFELEEWAKAALKYEEFVIFYPGSDEAEYAQYKLILCTFYLSLKADLDQDDTYKTIELINVFLTKAKDEKFIAETKKIHATCRYRLLEHEVVALETYLKQYKFTAVQKRIEYIQERFQDIEHLEKYVAYLNSWLERVKNLSTRPFVFHLSLPDALGKKEVKALEVQDAAKAVSFFVA